MGFERFYGTSMAWINAGAIGKLQEVHNWTNRQVWPHIRKYQRTIRLFHQDWIGTYGSDLKLIVLTLPIIPHGIRGWYDFGGGSMADMGHYSLWTVFNALKLTSPTVVEPNLSHVVGMHDPFLSRSKMISPSDGKYGAF